MPLPPMTPERMAALRAARTAKHADQASKAVQVGVYTLTPDFLRGGGNHGAGYRLSAPKQPDRFFRTEEQAREWVASHHQRPLLYAEAPPGVLVSNMQPKEWDAP
jgi:hypothetical protein